MDALVGLLDGPRAHRAFLLRSMLDPPWSLRIEDEAPLTIVTVVRGGAWIMPDRGDPSQLAAGGTAILRGPDHYTVADAPATPPQVIIDPGQRCTTVDGEDVFEAMSLGVRTWGNSRNGATVLLTGTYELDGEVGRTLLRALPATILVPGASVDASVSGLLAAEVTREEPGQRAVLDRLLDLLLVMVLRAWFARREAETPSWFAAHGDPVVGVALRLMHDNPAHPWTVAELSAAAGALRAALAQRFAGMLGEPPMAYLTRWRLDLAADLLRDPELTIGAIAGRVGYGSPYSLSTAFKRAHGVSPSEYRRRRARRRHTWTHPPDADEPPARGRRRARGRQAFAEPDPPSQPG